MLTKDQAKIIELKYTRIIEGVQSELENFTYRKTINNEKLRKLADEFFSYINSITETK